MSIRPHRQSALRAPVRRGGGFTLIELLVAIVILGIVASLAGPSFKHVRDRHLTSASMNDLLADVSFARSEATRQRRNVIMCARPAHSGESSACTPANADGTGIAGGSDCACSGSSGWENGWLSFVDSDASGTLSNADRLLSAYPQLDRFESLRRSGAGTFSVSGTAVSTVGHLAFTQRGGLLGPAATFALCLPKGAGSDADVLDKARFLEVSRTGRAAVRVARDTELTVTAACVFG